LWRTIFILHEVHGHHDHTSNPEEDDVKTSHQYISWVEGIEEIVFRIFLGIASPT
jgi:fatty acid desaturase